MQQPPRERHVTCIVNQALEAMYVLLTVLKNSFYDGYKLTNKVQGTKPHPLTTPTSNLHSESGASNTLLLKSGLREVSSNKRLVAL